MRLRQGQLTHTKSTILVEFVILEEEKLVIERFIDVVDYESIRDASYAIWSDPKYNKYYKGLIDIRGCLVTFNIQDLARLTTFFLKNASTSKGSIVILADSSQGIAKSYIFNNRVSRFMNITVLSNVEYAFRQLAINQEIFNKIIGPNASQVQPKTKKSLSK